MIYVMSDIHGNARRFVSVMRRIDLQSQDTLDILGDVFYSGEPGCPEA